MDNRTTLIGAIVVIAVLLIAGWFWYGWNGSGTGTENGQNPNAKGTLYFAVKDAAADMRNITAVQMTLDKVYVHSQTQGWVLVSDDPQTFSLLELKESGKAALLAKANVVADTYDQVWFHMADVKVTQSGKVKTATLPSNDFKLNSKVTVTADGNSTATLDIFADQSIYQTSGGEVVFAPVVNFESRNGTSVTVDASNMVTATSGTVDANINAGMDVSGEVKNDFRIDTNSNLQINGGVINIQGQNGADMKGTVNGGATLY